MRINNFFKFVIALLASFAAGGIGSIFTSIYIPTWYEALNKPVFSPPNWLFGPVWTLLYVLMAIAAYLVWKQGWEAREDIKEALGVFVIQLELNLIWSIIFFGLQSPGWAFLEIVILWLVIIWNIVTFYRVNRAAAYLLIPYLLWVTFASILNCAVWLIN